MTDNKIFELASQHLLYPEGEGERAEWPGDKQDVLEFARVTRAQSFRDGYYSAVEDQKRYAEALINPPAPNAKPDHINDALRFMVEHEEPNVALTQQQTPSPVSHE